MKLTVRMQKVILELICLLYILLFVYAAVSKLLDFENFQVQLGQSPLLSAFAGWVAWIVPIVEIIIEHKIKELTTPFNMKFWHILQSIEGKLALHRIGSSLKTSNENNNLKAVLSINLY